jgi:magnesium-transporting ATPase (P-type)
VNVFAEVEPNQKKRIIVALKKAGNVVGYVGDGINDALHQSIVHRKPSPYLFWTTIAIAVITVILPYVFATRPSKLPD